MDKKTLLRLKLLFAFLIIVMPASATSVSGETVKPWTFWYWMYGQVSDEGIRADLKAMKDVGIGGFYLMPIKHSSGFTQLPPGKEKYTADQLSEEWWRRMDTVFKVADSLGLEMGIHFSDGFALGGGPWITQEESMQRVVCKDTVILGCKVQGAETNNQQPITNNHITTFIYPAPYYDPRTPTSSVQFPFSSKEPCEITMSYDAPFTLRSVKVITGGNNIQAHRWKVYASDDSCSWQFLRQIEPARRGWQDTDAYTTYSIPATKARYFRFCWTPEGSDPGSEDLDAAKWKPNLKVGNLVLSSEPVIDNYEAKSGVVWRVAEEAKYNDDCYYQLADFKSAETNSQQPHNRITAQPHNRKTAKPQNRYYHILTISHASTGHENATGGGGKGLECDKFSRTAIRKQFSNWFGAILQRKTKSTNNQQPITNNQPVITRLHVDSWECGSQNWSDNFADEFRARRGYDLMPWMPLFAGVPMVSREKSEAVLRDVRLTIAELINDIFFDEVSTLASSKGMKLSCESVAPTMVSDGMLHYQHADYPMGEFWLNSPTHDKPNDMLDAISGAHVYGKNIVQAEGFTDVRATWDETPAMLKPLLDRMFCLGMNSIVYHVNTHNPWLDLKPGMTLDGIGTFFQRDNTWWPEMTAFNHYVTLCQQQLQRGRPVVDIAVYTGDEVPRRALLPERLTESLPGLFGDSLLSREQYRLANEGVPMEVSPVGVNHTKNLTRADMFTNPLHGYKYDSMNHDVLRTSRVENGELITQGGMHYKVLVVPQHHALNPNGVCTAEEEIQRLQQQGLPVIHIPWTLSDLSAIGIERDAVVPEGIDFCHRHTDEGDDIYFLANLTDSAITFTPQFRGLQTNSQQLLLPAHHSVFCHVTGTGVTYNHTLTTLTNNQKPIGNYVLDSGLWTLDFERTGKKLTTRMPFDWSTVQDSTVKYYSGHAAYTHTFRASKAMASSQTLLDLGDVRDVATVYVNGICCGTVWMAPYIVDITRAIRKGKNTISIQVVNTWNNALLGNDRGTPPFPRIWTNGKYRPANNQLLPAGILSIPRILTFDGKE